MKRQMLVLVGLLGFAANTLAAEPEAEGYQPIRDLSACLNPERAVNWQRLDDYSLLVDDTRHKFRVLLTEPCPSLTGGATLVFESAGSNRICGRPGEAIRTRAMRCGIRRVIPIEAEAASADEK